MLASSLCDMRRRFVLPAVALLSMSLVACGSQSSSDTVPQPGAELSDANTADPGAGDVEAQAAAAACNAGKPIAGRPLRVASTVAPITNLIGLIAGSTGTVVNGIVPEGTNSHTYEPPPSAAVNLENADAVFVNGLALDDPTRDLASSSSKNTLICEVGTAILPKTGWIYDFSFPKEAGHPNPHVWTNPPMVLSYVTAIRDVLATLDPTHAAQYDDNYVKLSSVIMQLDAAMKTAVETIPANDRKLLTYHDAYAYFAQHYDMEIIGAIQPASFEEPSPQDIANLIAQVKSSGVKAIFGSEVFPSSVLEQIGKETGVRYVDTLRDDDLPGKPGDVDHSWAGLMKFDFITIVEALGGDAKVLKAVNINTKVPDKANYPQ